MRYDDFCRCTVDEFEAICRAWKEQRRAEMMDGWERMRLLAAITIQPHVKGKIDAARLLPLPWDKKPKTRAAKGTSDKTRFETLTKQLEEDGKGQHDSGNV